MNIIFIICNTIRGGGVWGGGGGRRPRPPGQLDILHIGADEDFDVASLGGFFLHSSEEALPGVHQVCEHLVFLPGDVSDFLPLFIEDQDGQGVGGVVLLPSELDNRPWLDVGGPFLAFRDMGGARNPAFHQENLLEEGHGEAAILVEELCEFAPVLWGNQSLFHGG